MNKSKQYKRNEWIMIFVLLMMVMSGTQIADATTPICCINFITSDGTQISAMDSTADWTVVGTDASSSVVTDAVEGVGAVKLSLKNGNPATMTKTINIDFSAQRNFVFWAKVDNISNVSAVDLYVSNTAPGAFTDYLYINVFPLDNKWHQYVIDQSVFNKVAAGSFSNPILQIRFKVDMVAGAWANVTFDNLSYNMQGKPKVIISFDDGLESVYLKAKPVMDSNAQRGVIFVPTADINGFNFDSTTELQNFKNAGWDISSHTENQTNLSTLSIPQIDSELNNSFNYLANNGFWSSAWVMSYPNGAVNDTIITEVKKTYLIGRSIQNPRYYPGNLTNVSMNSSYLVHSLGVSNTTTVATVFGYINQTINQSSLLVMHFHNITNGNAVLSTDYTTSNFTLISNYLASRSNDIDVVTFQDYLQYSNIVWSRNGSSLIYNNISSTGRINYTNGLTYLVNASVIPSSGYVNMSISTWNTAGNYSKVFTASSNTHINPTTFTIGDFPANSNIRVNKNGVFDNYYVSNSSGYIIFTHDTYSDVVIEAFLVPTTIELLTCPSVNNDINAAFGLIGVLLIVFAAGMLISGIRSMNYPFMIVGIGAAITGAIMIIVGYFITITISNGVGCLG